MKYTDKQLIAISPKDCPHCHGEGFLFDWYDWGETSVPGPEYPCDCSMNRLTFVQRYYELPKLTTDADDDALAHYLANVLR